MPAARRHAARRLLEAGIDNAALEARWLVEHLGGGEAAAGWTPTMAAALDQAVDRRLAGEPFWRILGEREFWGLPFRLSPATLEPRPDSETLITAALEQIGARRQDPLRILDLGTGTGCLLVTLLTECPAAMGVGIDLSSEACETARSNAALNGVAGRTLFREGSWTVGLDGRFDLIVSNPPYIPSADIATLDAVVRDHDPLLALDGGRDGLDPYRIFAGTLPDRLADGGHVLLEIGAGQEEDVKAIMRKGGFAWLASRRDLGGHSRALVFALH
ncbi:MAG TPA: peptide chain release factor N(5)-glutamine methyltransferase [Bosea sp. (in: a-proteobacteria)]|uniref:peptide chain release factor N(5)-glutamine methyltransferase n=1 Tax=Bosea sp. (in: a-proteobacteria) TaxID=1871050 RepID=UPI002DDDA364|nr:peptide chain release factor N(5)-glutamine methyltransferase [Bosea sp. (in: a-proteobacteria)]HEV2554087.1 peptide chain release factor N(5)-glutamine methyltransferase [Bosea sp. (in: a-proteobacteria)]